MEQVPVVGVASDWYSLACWVLQAIGTPSRAGCCKRFGLPPVLGVVVASDWCSLPCWVLQAIGAPSRAGCCCCKRLVLLSVLGVVVGSDWCSLPCSLFQVSDAHSRAGYCCKLLMLLPVLTPHGVIMNQLGQIIGLTLHLIFHRLTIV